MRKILRIELDKLFDLSFITNDNSDRWWYGPLEKLMIVIRPYSTQTMDIPTEFRTIALCSC